MNLAQMICGLRGRHEWKWANIKTLVCDRCRATILAPPAPKSFAEKLADYGPAQPPLRTVFPPLRTRHLRLDEFIGEVLVRCGGSYGKWGLGGPNEGVDEFVITHVRLVDLKSNYMTERRDMVLFIGNSFSLNLGSAIGVDLACSGEDRKGWIKLRFPAVIAKDAFFHEVFRLDGPTDLEVRLDVIANIARSVQ